MNRRMTQTEAGRITCKLFHEHKLTGWGLRYGNAKRVAGSCDYRHKRITLSKYLLAQRSYEESLNTIVHEIAHALTKGHNHDAVWAAKHRELGGDGKRCFQHHDEQAPIVGRCPHGKEFPRYRWPKRPDAWSCRCRSALLGGPSGKIVWERRAS